MAGFFYAVLRVIDFTTNSRIFLEDSAIRG